MDDNEPQFRIQLFQWQWPVSVMPSLTGDNDPMGQMNMTRPDDMHPPLHILIVYPMQPPTNSYCFALETNEHKLVQLVNGWL